MAFALAERLCALPAVATTNWPELAARALALIEPATLGWVLIAQVDDRGAIVSREAAGVGSASPASDRASLLALRSAVERVDDLGFAPTNEDLARGVAGPADTLIGSAWRDTSFARAWAPSIPAQALIGVSSLGSIEHRRVLIAGLGLTRPGDDAARLLAGAMPVLVRRAVLAIGARPSTASRWLTDREQIVLERLALGRSVREIAEEIDRSPHTVHDHVKSLHRKLNASSRGELVARALGYIDDDHRVVGTFAAQAEAALKPQSRAADPSLEREIRGHDVIAEPKPDGAPRPADHRLG